MYNLYCWSKPMGEYSKRKGRGYGQVESRGSHIGIRRTGHVTGHVCLASFYTTSTTMTCQYRYATSDEHTIDDMEKFALVSSRVTQMGGLWRERCRDTHRRSDMTSAAVMTEIWSKSYYTTPMLHWHRGDYGTTENMPEKSRRTRNFCRGLSGMSMTHTKWFKSLLSMSISDNLLVQCGSATARTHVNGYRRSDTGCLVFRWCFCRCQTCIMSITMVFSALHHQSDNLAMFHTMSPRYCVTLTVSTISLLPVLVCTFWEILVTTCNCLFHKCRSRWCQSQLAPNRSQLLWYPHWLSHSSNRDPLSWVCYS